MSGGKNASLLVSIRSAPGPLCIFYDCYLGISVELLTMREQVYLTLLPALGTLLLLLGCLIQPRFGGICFVLLCPVWLLSLRRLHFSEKEMEGEWIRARR